MPTPRRPRCAAHLPSRGEIRAQRRQGGPTPPDPRARWPCDGKRRSSSSPAAHPSLARGPRRRSPSPVAQQLSPAAAVLRPTAGWSLHRVATYPAYPQHHAGSRPPLVSPPLPSPPGHGGIQGRHIKLRTATARLPLSDTALSSSRPLLRPVGC